MLFVPPSIPYMVPEAEAIKIQDKGDFILYYIQTDNFAEYEKLLKSSEYLEKKVKWLKDLWGQVG